MITCEIEILNSYIYRCGYSTLVKLNVVYFTLD